jgi:hypothetical protein
VKTIREWLETIEDKDIRDQAIFNYETQSFKQYDADNNIDYKSLTGALWDCFNFQNTPQGFWYWHDVYEKLKTNGL